MGLTLTLGLALGGGYAHSMELITPVAHVDLTRFMGDWYVIATIPTIFEKNAYNGLETYERRPDGNVDTSFRFRNGSLDAPVKTIHSTGFVKEGAGNAVWGVEVFWPIKAQYIVAYLADDYSAAIVARDARDYVWVMARTPTLAQDTYDALIARVQKLGYPASKIRKVPQQWPEASR